MPDIQFINSPKSEEKRYRETQKEVANSWFADHGFLVVPEIRKEIGAQIQVIYPKKMQYSAVETDKFRVEWERVQEQFWAELDHYLPEARKMHSQVRVDIGRIGTISSSYWTPAHYYLRADRSVGDLAAMMVNHVLYAGRKNLGITWTKREALMDFVMTRPVMARLFPDFHPVFLQLSRIPTKWRKYSEDYVRELGLAKAKSEFEISGGKVVIMGKIIERELTKREKLAMKLLIEHRGELVSYDEIADLIWGVGEFKTFWAINKLVERMRPKLEKMGLDRGRLESIRGQGYLLK